MKKVIVLIALFCSTVALAQSKTVKLSPFSGLKVYSGIHVKLIPSQENKIVISGENIETVVTTLKKDILKIRHSLDQWLSPSNTYIEVYFTETLDKIHSYQGTKIESEALLETTSIEVKASEGSQQFLNIITERLDASINSGATLNLTGKASTHELSILGGGICEAEDFITNQTIAKVTAGGVAYIHASELLDATVNIGGTVRIHGQPTKLIKRKRIGGTIMEMN